jgi:hypothetical protein
MAGKTNQGAGRYAGEAVGVPVNDSTHYSVFLGALPPCLVGFLS